MDRYHLETRIVHLNDSIDKKDLSSGFILLVPEEVVHQYGVHKSLGIIGYDKEQADQLDGLVESIDNACNADYLIGLDVNDFRCMFNREVFLFEVCHLDDRKFAQRMQGSKKLLIIIESEEAYSLLDLNDFFHSLEAHIGRWDELMYGSVIVKGESRKVTVLFKRTG